MADRIPNFEEFWPYYLGEHRDPFCRILHFAGTSVVFTAIITSAVTLNPWLLLPLPVFGYGPAWVGHFIIEKNRPATFTYPLWSLLGDLKMWSHMIRGRLWTGNDPAAEVMAATQGA